MTKVQRASLLIVVIITAALVRLYRLDYQSVWYDEAVVVLFASKSLSWIFAHIPQDTMPPLSYLLLHFWLELGRQESVMRVLTALFSIGAIPLTFLLARYLFGYRVALVATAITAISPFQAYFAQEARMYAQLSFFSLAAAYCLLRAWQGRCRRFWAGFALASIGAAYTHNFGLLWLFSLNVCAVLSGVRDQGSGVWGRGPGPWPLAPGPYLAANGLIAVTYAPWLPVLWQQAIQVKGSFWIAPPGPLAIPATLYSFVFAHTLADSLFLAGLFLVVFLTFLGLYRVVRGTGDDGRLILFCLGLLLLPPLLAFLVSFLRPIYLDRALIGSSFFLYIFLAWTLLRLQPGWLRWLLGGALAASLVAGLYNYYFVPSFAKPPLREAALALAVEVRPGDVVLHTSDGSFLPFVFYHESSQRKDRHKLVAGDPERTPGSARRLALSMLGLEDGKVEDLVAGKERVWLVVALDHSVDWQLATKRWFDERYRLEAERDFRGIKLYLYSRSPTVTV